ncbi:unnamed protein product, partial [Medioppia subpectinata]
MDSLMKTYLMAIIFIVYIQTDGDVVMASMVCAYSKPQADRSVRSVTTDKSTESIDSNEELNNQNETVIECPADQNSCYTLWRYNPIDPTNASLYVILAKGCWDTSTNTECQTEQCFSYKKPVEALNHTKFCCCFGPLCNANLSADSYFNTHQPIQPFARYSNENEKNISNKAVMVACMAALISIVLLVLGFT